MRRRAFFTLASVCAAPSFAFAACGDSDPTSMMAMGVGGADEGDDQPNSGGSAGRAMGGSDDGGGGSSGRGGSGGSSPGGSSSGGRSGGASGSRATGGSSGEGGAGGSGEGGEGGRPPDPVVCDRLGALPAERIAERVTLGYEQAFFRDCRLSWFTTLYLQPTNQRALFLNNLSRFSLVLWGCVDEEPSAFALIHSEVPLSGAEADALIELYLNQSRIEASLSPAEIAPIRRELERLCAPLIDTTLADFSRSRCPDAGAGDAGPGEGGAGGAPVSSAMGAG